MHLGPKVPRAPGALSYSRCGSWAKRTCLPQTPLEVQPLGSTQTRRVTAARTPTPGKFCTVLSCLPGPALHGPAGTHSVLGNSFNVWVLPLPPRSALSSSKKLKLFAVFLSLNENLLYLSLHSTGLVLTFSLVQNTPASSIP